MTYKISNSIVIKYEDSEEVTSRIGQADMNIENLARKLKNKGKCISREVFGSCYLEDKRTWWSVVKEYEILREPEKFKNLL